MNLQIQEQVKKRQKSEMKQCSFDWTLVWALCGLVEYKSSIMNPSYCMAWYDFCCRVDMAKHLEFYDKDGSTGPRHHCYNPRSASFAVIVVDIAFAVRSLVFPQIPKHPCIQFLV